MNNLSGVTSDSKMTSERISACMLEIRALQDVIDKFKLINVDPTEFTCLKAIVIFKTGTIHAIILQSLDGKFVTRRAIDKANIFSLFNVKSQ